MTMMMRMMMRLKIRLMILMMMMMILVINYHNDVSGDFFLREQARTVTVTDVPVVSANNVAWWIVFGAVLGGVAAPNTNIYCSSCHTLLSSWVSFNSFIGSIVYNGVGGSFC